MATRGPKVLVIEDDPDIRCLLEWHLQKDGFTVLAADNGDDGIDVFARERPEVVLLDIMMPGADGWQVCRQMRAMEGTARTRIIIVSARTQEGDVLRGLELGADDYVRKPFRPKEVIARVRTVLRRRPLVEGSDPGDVFRHSALTLDHARREVRVDGRRLILTATEYNLVHVLISHPGRVFTREQLLMQFGLQLPIGSGRSIDVHVRALRKKLGRHAGLIETSRGVGYRLGEVTAGVDARDQGAAR